MSDHNLVIIDTSLEYKDIDTDSKRNCSGLDGLNFFHDDINWDAINDTLMEKRWHKILAGKNMDEINEKIHEIIT